MPTRMHSQVYEELADVSESQQANLLQAQSPLLTPFLTGPNSVHEPQRFPLARSLPRRQVIRRAHCGSVARDKIPKADSLLNPSTVLYHQAQVRRPAPDPDPDSLFQADFNAALHTHTETNGQGFGKEGGRPGEAKAGARHRMMGSRGPPTSKPHSSFFNVLLLSCSRFWLPAYPDCQTRQQLAELIAHVLWSDLLRNRRPCRGRCPLGFDGPADKEGCCGPKERAP